jgi:hypothetical protein
VQKTEEIGRKGVEILIIIKNDFSSTIENKKLIHLLLRNKNRVVSMVGANDSQHTK